MVKNTHPFNCSYDLCWNLEKFANELSDMMSEAKGFELREMEPAMHHLAAFREAMVAIEEKVFSRIELERIADLAERDIYTIETVDGEPLKFDAPNGFEIIKQATIYTNDLHKLEIVDGKIVGARNVYQHRYLNQEELDKCNSEFRLVQG